MNTKLLKTKEEIKKSLKKGEVVNLNLIFCRVIFDKESRTIKASPKTIEFIKNNYIKNPTIDNSFDMSIRNIFKAKIKLTKETILDNYKNITFEETDKLIDLYLLKLKDSYLLKLIKITTQLEKKKTKEEIKKSEDKKLEEWFQSY